jgi:hypothetical protein
MSMGVYLPNMEMPTTGLYFVSVDNSNGFDKTVVTVERMLGNRDVRQIIGSYEAVPVPQHGRLIDADALMHEFEKAQRTMAQHGQEYSCSFMSSSQELSTEWYCVEDMLENALTIIPAEEGET